MRSTLESKTIRPGLAAYSFYRSDRHPLNRSAAKPKAKRRRTSQLGMRLLTGVAIVAAVVFGYKSALAPSHDGNSNAPVITLAKAVNQANPCVGGSLDKYIVVSISHRHLWACQVHQLVYDTPVITGMSQYASTVTPTGTFHIAAKQTNTTLTGSDEAGSWNDPVHYWMPWLTNQYGEYGFHDATWRPGNPFGKIDPSSSDASHGCVELPLAAAAWIFNWAPVGTTVAIEA